MIRFLKTLIRMPLCIMLGAIGDIDEDELFRAIEKRRARAERAVIRDYLSQHEVEGEQAEEAMESLTEKMRKRRPSSERISELEQRAKTAEEQLEKTRFDYKLRDMLAEKGVVGRNANDAVTLALSELTAEQGKDISALSKALDAVIERLPSLTSANAAASTGAKGDHPRTGDTHSYWQQRLETARRTGDNAAAVKILTEAAQNGILLR